MIKDFEVGKNIVEVLLIKEATARETKTKKPYLALVLTDGVSTISGNYWDWNGKVVPPKNEIVKVTAQVTSWQDATQLNVQSLTKDFSATVADFIPESGIDIEAIFRGTKELIAEIEDENLHTLTLRCFNELQVLWLTVPGAITVHHAYKAGTLIHSHYTARIAKGIAEAISGANVDLCIAGALLHDIGKLYAYQFEGAVIEMTDEGKLYDHSFIGARFLAGFMEGIVLEGPAGDAYNTMKNADNYPLFQQLISIVLSHHGALEHGAIVQPCSLEAHIVHHADKLDATAEILRTASAKSTGMWTDRIWALDNRPHLNMDYMDQFYYSGE